MKTAIKTLCLVTFLAFSTQSQAQTKEETVQWLTGKMKKKNFFQLYYDKTAPVEIYEVSFNDNFLYIFGEYKHSYREYGIDYEIIEFFKYNINLSKLSDNVYYLGSYIQTNGNYIEEDIDWKKYRYKM